MTAEPTRNILNTQEVISLLADLISRSEFEKANGLASKAIARFPDNGDFLTLHGIALLNLDKMDLAAVSLRAAIQYGAQQARFWLWFLERYGTLPKYLRSTQLQIEGLRRSTYMDYPTEVTIETFAQCNAACDFCPYHKIERKGQKMPDDLISKIIKDLTAIPTNIPFSITPFKVNEPFLDKRLFSICASINQHLPHAKLRIFSNGSPLTKNTLEQFAQLRNIEKFWISLNSHEESEYERIMQLSFEGTLRKLDGLHDLVKSGLFKIPVVISRVGEGNQKDVAFTSFVKDRFPLFEPFLLNRTNWAGQISMDAPPVAPSIGCLRWFELSIMANGKVALCCMDGEGRHVIGNAQEENLLDIYNRPEYRTLRANSLTRLATKAPCNTCSYY